MARWQLTDSLPLAYFCRAVVLPMLGVFGVVYLYQAGFSLTAILGYMAACFGLQIIFANFIILGLINRLGCGRTIALGNLALIFYGLVLSVGGGSLFLALIGPGRSLGFL